MNRNYLLANAILWASAIIASAILDAPVALSAILLPTLATASLLLAGPKLRMREGARR